MQGQTNYMRKHCFDIPEGIVYLDGNSLGPPAITTAKRVDHTVNAEWRQLLIKGWNEAGWYMQPRTLGDRLAPLIGAAPGSVVLGDTLSIKIYQALAAALKMRPQRRVILSDKGNFPSDLYIAEGLVKTLGQDYELRLVEPEVVADHLDESVAALLLTQVDYRTGRLHNMADLTRKAHEKDVVAIWDLAHSAGAIPVDLAGCNPEFAAGCTYKYLNAGPGAPAFVYVRPDIADEVEPALSGWMGHVSPFGFETTYKAAPAIERMRVGTPSVLQMAALDAALDVWDGVSMTELRAQSIELSELFIREVEAQCPQLTLVSPRNPEQRGSQVSFTFAEGYAVMQALIAKGVIGDFRAPDVIRFGFTPLYLDKGDVQRAVDILADIMTNKLWDVEEFKTQKAVT